MNRIDRIVGAKEGLLLLSYILCILLIPSRISSLCPSGDEAVGQNEQD
jgi:hypothetical protein